MAQGLGGHRDDPAIRMVDANVEPVHVVLQSAADVAGAGLQDDPAPQSGREIGIDAGGCAHALSWNSGRFSVTLGIWASDL
jgi:hypothetical protein